MIDNEHVLSDLGYCDDLHIWVDFKNNIDDTWNQREIAKWVAAKIQQTFRQKVEVTALMVKRDTEGQLCFLRIGGLSRENAERIDALVTSCEWVRAASPAADTEPYTRTIESNETA